ncbi:olfactory receptor 2B11-like [Eriocheir sinensis]|uniref:olfactory receptor 2B11-like n=1 Tax=Eriocheir sinensis TaxID=95602 RepID=UPI0021C5AE3F|nr:olfactory receptor 2B11-like [Eriocheir sinensis]
MSLNVTEGVSAVREAGGVDNKLHVYMAFSLVTVAECLLAGYLTFTSHELQRRRSTVFSWLLILSIGTFASLSLVYVLVLITVPGASYKSPFGCRVRVVQRYLSVVSCFSLACLSLDRYLAICWPLRYHELLNKTRCQLLCLACWLVPAVLLVLPCVGVLSTMCEKGKTEKRLLVAYVVAYTLGAMTTLVLYLLVALEFCNTPVSRRGSLGDGPVNGDVIREVSIVRHRTAKSALTVLMLYTVLSLPHTLLPVVSSMGQHRVPYLALEISYLVHRLHLFLFLPMYAGTNVYFWAALSAWGKVLWRRLTCWCHAAEEREITRVEAPGNRSADDLL